MSRNFLVIAPNIIVLDRLKTDFEGLKIFFEDPLVPPNGTTPANVKIQASASSPGKINE
jgi:type III restriction enzyme